MFWDICKSLQNEQNTQIRLVKSVLCYWILVAKHDETMKSFISMIARQFRILNVLDWIVNNESQLLCFEWSAKSLQNEQNIQIRLVMSIFCYWILVAKHDETMKSFFSMITRQLRILNVFDWIGNNESQLLCFEWSAKSLQNEQNIQIRLVKSIFCYWILVANHDETMKSFFSMITMRLRILNVLEELVKNKSKL